MNTALIILIDGLVFASWLFLVAAGLTLIYGVLRILNIAHGSFYALGAYVSASLIITYFNRNLWPYGSYILLIVAPLLAGVILGPLVERGFLRPMYGREQVLQLLVTYALLLIFEDVIKLVWGVDPYYAYKPYSLLGQIRLGGIVYSRYSFLLIVAAILAAAFLWGLVNRTRFGRLLIAVIHDREMSIAMGINAPRVYVVAFTVGTVLAALGGAFTAPMISVVPGISVEVIVLAFAVVVIGGLGSLEGAILGALMVGLVRAAAIHLFPALELFTVYLIMALVLLFRPHGLFAREEIRRI